MNAVKLDVIEDSWFGSCLKLSDSVAEVRIPLTAGPRIIHYGFCGGRNHLFIDRQNRYVLETKEHQCLGKGPWRLIGGHRLGVSPEEYPGSVYPENDAVAWHESEGGVQLEAAAETWTSLQKRVEVRFTGKPGEVSVKHFIYNRGDRDVTLAAWPITAMAGGGTAVIPLPVGGSAYKPNWNMALWPYGTMNDPRIGWGEDYITIHQAEGMPKWKFGCYNAQGWLAYLNQNEAFLKRFAAANDPAVYPDRGSSCEIYTNEDFLELESLSPLATIRPGDKVEFEEHWRLLKLNMVAGEIRGDSWIRRFIERMNQDNS
jgi:hypothetical protein